MEQGSGSVVITAATIAAEKGVEIVDVTTIDRPSVGQELM